MPTYEDTIAATATAPGQGGIAIVRVSGSRAEEFLKALFPERREFESHKMYYGHAVFQGETLDECMAVLMRAPKSYTREDVAEFHLHGGSWASQRVLAALFSLGAREAEAGEFTKRAFLNGRIDLSQAEAVMNVIAAESDKSARAALRQLSGGVNGFIRSAQEKLLSLLSGVEAALDYPDEVSDEEAWASLERGARTLADELDSACDERSADILENGLDVVLCGRPNVGKSSLLNALLHQNRAIVTSIPGTTRDIVQGSFQLNGVKINLSDTAGLRENAEEIEKIGIERAREAISRADVTLAVLDASCPLEEEDLSLLSETAHTQRIIVLNKIDLGCAAVLPEPAGRAIPLSARTGEGVEKLRRALSSLTENVGKSELTQARHMRLAREAARALRSAADAHQKGQPVDLAAIDLHTALDCLGRVTGDRVDEKLLDSVFSRFCVGK